MARAFVVGKTTPCKVTVGTIELAGRSAHLIRDERSNRARGGSRIL